MSTAKKELMLILSCIGTSFGVIGTAGWSLYLGIKVGHLFTIWGSAIGIGITLFGLGVWSSNLIIAFNRYLLCKKEEKRSLEMLKQPFVICDENIQGKSKQKGDK